MKQLAMEVKAAEADWWLCSSVLTKLWLRLFWFSSGSSPTQLRNDDVHSVVLRHYLVHSPDPTQTSFTNSSFLWPSRSQKTFSVDVGISLSCCICTSAASRSFHSRARSWVCFLTSTLNQDGCKTLALSLVAQRTACVREGQLKTPFNTASHPPIPPARNLEDPCTSPVCTRNRPLSPTPVMKHYANICGGMSRKGWTWKARQHSWITTCSCWTSCKWTLSVTAGMVTSWIILTPF